MKRVGVGSTNPSKLEAAKQALEKVSEIHPEFRDFELVSLEVPSGVSAQPFSEAETKQGALNRARAVLSQDSSLDVAIGMEGGVSEHEDGLYSTVWVSVVDKSGRETSANGARFRLPSFLAEPIRAGEEMGPALDKNLGTQKINHREGMVGVMTQSVVTRAEEYGNITTLALGLYLAEIYQLE